MKESKITSGYIAQVGGGRSQNVGTGTSAKNTSRKLASLIDDQRQVAGSSGPAANRGNGQPTAPVGFRFEAPGAGKPGKRVSVD